MTHAIRAALVCAAILTTPAYAGGVAEPVMEPAVVVADTAASGSDEWVGIVMTLLTIAAVAAN